jgi:cytochrome P450
MTEQAFIPPAIFPPKKPPGLIEAVRSIRTSIDAWPAQVFEGGFYRSPYPGAPLVVSDPAMAAEILKDKAEDFPRGEIINRLFRPVWGRGVFVSEGDEWRWQRRAAAPAFRPAAMAGLVPFFRRAAERTLASWAGGEVINLHDEARKLTVNALFDAVLSGGEDFPDKAEAGLQIDAFVAGIGRFQATDFLPMPNSWRASTERRGGKPAAYIRAHVGAMVARRRREGRGGGDLVDLLVSATDPETGRQMDDELLRDNLVGFIAAGHETSAYALSWALWLVASHPPTERRVLAEIEEVAGEAPIDASHVERLAFVKQVIQETMRLYPGAVIIARTAARNTSVGGHHVRRGEIVTIATYALHRRADIWSSPNVFDPDRFSPDKQTERAPFAYLPFGVGPRVCMGAAFAMTELITAFATLVREVKLMADPDRPIEIDLRLLGLVARGGMWMTAKRR